MDRGLHSKDSHCNPPDFLLENASPHGVIRSRISHSRVLADPMAVCFLRGQTCFRYFYVFLDEIASVKSRESAMHVSE